MSDDQAAGGVTTSDTPPLVGIKAVPPYQVVYDGIVYGPGQTGQVPHDVAAYWAECGWAVINDQPVTAGA